MTLDELKAGLDEFSPAKVEFVSRMVDSLSRPQQVDIGSETWITASPDWVEYFGLSLSVHHGATPEPLALTAFETAFRNACGYVRWPVDEPGVRSRRRRLGAESGGRRELNLPAGNDTFHSTVTRTGLNPGTTGLNLPKADPVPGRIPRQRVPAAMPGCAAAFAERETACGWMN